MSFISQNARWEFRGAVECTQRINNVGEVLMPRVRWQAGSDSLLTSSTFLKLMRTSFDGVAGVKKHVGILYGLGSGAPIAPHTSLFPLLADLLASVLLSPVEPRALLVVDG